MQLSTGELSIKKTSAAIEEILIRRALTKTKGNRTRAAEDPGNQPSGAPLQNQGLQDLRLVTRSDALRREPTSSLV